MFFFLFLYPSPQNSYLVYIFLNNNVHRCVKLEKRQRLWGKKPHVMYIKQLFVNGVAFFSMLEINMKKK